MATERSAPATQAAVHIELADARIKSVKHQAGKAIWTIECDAPNQNTTLADIDSVLGENYKSQIVIEAQYEEPVEEPDKGGIDPRQQKLDDWSQGGKDGGAAAGS